MYIARRLSFILPTVVSMTAHSALAQPPTPSAQLSTGSLPPVAASVEAGPKVRADQTSQRLRTITALAEAVGAPPELKVFAREVQHLVRRSQAALAAHNQLIARGAKHAADAAKYGDYVGKIDDAVAQIEAKIKRATPTLAQAR